MSALRLYAGPTARRHIEQHGLRPHDVGIIPAAAGGPKGLILGPLDRFLFGEWLPRSDQAVHLVGASIGAWRMATACLDNPVEAFERLERDYIAQHYDLPAGQKRPTASQISQRFGENLQLFYGGRVEEALHNPRYRLHIVTSKATCARRWVTLVPSPPMRCTARRWAPGWSGWCSRPCRPARAG
jgi:hypothetical protein